MAISRCNTLRPLLPLLDEPVHKLLVELASQQVINKLSPLRLIVNPNSLVLKNQVIVPSSLDSKCRCRGCCRPWGIGRSAESGLEVHQRVACSDLSFTRYGCAGSCFSIL